MLYRFIDYVPAADGHGVGPDCPAGTSFLCLASIRGLGWGLFETDLPDEWDGGTVVSDDLAVLIESAKRYPPALALARVELEQVFGEHRPTQAEFASAYRVALEAHLSRQHESPYVLAPAVNAEGGYLTQGEWYWILEVSGSPTVASWVSDDFHIYENDLNDFDLTGQQLKRLGFVG